MKKIIVAPEAEADLDEISDYISLDNPDRAESFVGEIMSRFLTIGERPRSFPARSDLMQELRSAVHAKYIILFVEFENHVRIVRVLNGARDLDELFS